MRIGVGFPTVEIGADLAAVRDFVQTAEGLGYIHLRILDTVQGSKIRNRHIPRNTLAYSPSKRPSENERVMSGNVAILPSEVEPQTSFYDGLTQGA